MQPGQQTPAAAVREGVERQRRFREGLTQELMAKHGQDGQGDQGDQGDQDQGPERQ